MSNLTDADCYVMDQRLTAKQLAGLLDFLNRCLTFNCLFSQFLPVWRL